MSFEKLNDQLADLNDLLQEEAETTNDPDDCLNKIKQKARELSDTAQALTGADFDAEYEEGDVIDGEVVDV